MIGKTLVAKWKKEEKLTRKEAILAQCYICNGGEASDCGGKDTCPLYEYFSYRKDKI